MIRRVRFLLGILTIVLGWIGFSVSGQAPCEFVMPVSEIENAQFSFAYWHHDDGTTPGIDVSTGQLAATFDRIYDSPLFGYTMSFSTEIELDTLLAKSWLGTGSMSYRYYISELLPLFVYAGARIDAATYQIQPGFELRSGIGIGLLRDVTPLAKTQRIIAVLLAEGAITRTPSDQALFQIAETVARVETYDQFETYVVDTVGEIEAAIGAPLDPTAVLAVRAELERADGERYCGAILQGGVGYELIDSYGGLQDVLYVLSGDIAHAPTANSQFRGLISWSAASGDLLGENAATIDLSYTADLKDSNSVTASYTVNQVAAAAIEARITQTATVEYTLAMNQSDLLVSLALSRQTGDPDWTIDVSVSFELDLL